MNSSSPPVTAKEWHHTMKHDKVPVLELSVVRPSFPAKGKTARMERYFEHMAEQWKHRWQNKLFPAVCSSPEHLCHTPWKASFQYTVTYWHDPLLSLRIDIAEMSGNDEPLLFCLGETWDCSTGYPRTLRSFFPTKPCLWRKNLLNSLKEQAVQQIKSGESLLDRNCTSIMERTLSTDNFYITENGITIFYPLYILGPYAEGIPVFTVPFSSSLKQTDSLPNP